MTSLMLSSRHGHDGAAPGWRVLLGAGASVELASDGWTSLVEACEGGHAGVARARGRCSSLSADPAWRDGLLLSGASGHEGVARLLVDATGDDDPARGALARCCAAGGTAGLFRGADGGGTGRIDAAALRSALLPIGVTTA